ncbi:hypothetical protein BKA69DRAFT_1059792 [Paraphysoderma sedebokerense]|nr:hypothetical protein BKA69DRAFT_1059792 [Paraphysoderma sedebokerense]
MNLAASPLSEIGVPNSADFRRKRLLFLPDPQEEAAKLKKQLELREYHRQQMAEKQRKKDEEVKKRQLEEIKEMEKLEIIQQFEQDQIQFQQPFKLPNISSKPQNQFRLPSIPPNQTAITASTELSQKPTSASSIRSHQDIPQPDCTLTAATTGVPSSPTAAVIDPRMLKSRLPLYRARIRQVASVNSGDQSLVTSNGEDKPNNTKSFEVPAPQIQSYENTTKRTPLSREYVNLLSKKSKKTKRSRATPTSNDLPSHSVSIGQLHQTNNHHPKSNSSSIPNLPLLPSIPENNNLEEKPTENLQQISTPISSPKKSLPRSRRNRVITRPVSPSFDRDSKTSDQIHIPTPPISPPRSSKPTSSRKIVSTNSQSTKSTHTHTHTSLSSSTVNKPELTPHPTVTRPKKGLERKENKKQIEQEQEQEQVIQFRSNSPPVPALAKRLQNSHQDIITGETVNHGGIVDGGKVNVENPITLKNLLSPPVPCTRKLIGPQISESTESSSPVTNAKTVISTNKTTKINSCNGNSKSQPRSLNAHDNESENLDQHQNQNHDQANSRSNSPPIPTHRHHSATTPTILTPTPTNQTQNQNYKSTIPHPPESLVPPPHPPLFSPPSLSVSNSPNSHYNHRHSFNFNHPYTDACGENYPSQCYLQHLKETRYQEQNTTVSYPHFQNGDRGSVNEHEEIGYGLYGGRGSNRDQSEKEILKMIKSVCEVC